ncbi:hypothetical protein C8J56DRAFT_1131644 [Mycena floridula]|nr:hypothetical protein C8J56DRAFT_1131644 [Mycena floridula]
MLFKLSFGLLTVAALSVAIPTDPSVDKLWTGEEALAAGLLKIVPGPPEGLVNVKVNTTTLVTQSPEVASNIIFLWGNPGPSGVSYNPGTFGQGFFFCVDLTLRDTTFNNWAESYFAATDLSCTLYLNAGCTGSGIIDAPTGDFIALTGIFANSITSFACEWLG